MNYFLLTTLYTHFIWIFSVSIWLKHSKHNLNIDSDGHQIKAEKLLLNNKNTPQKHDFYIYTLKRERKSIYIAPLYSV